MQLKLKDKDTELKEIEMASDKILKDKEFELREMEMAHELKLKELDLKGSVNTPYSSKAHNRF